MSGQEGVLHLAVAQDALAKAAPHLPADTQFALAQAQRIIAGLLAAVEHLS